MDDYISRADLISFFCKWHDDLKQKMDEYIDCPSISYGYKLGKLQLEDCINAVERFPAADVRPVKEGEWIVRQRYEHYPSCRPYEELICPFCERTDHNGDGRFCGYCGAKMGGTP